MAVWTMMGEVGGGGGGGIGLWVGLVVAKMVNGDSGLVVCGDGGGCDSKATTVTATGGCYSGDQDDKFMYCCKDKNIRSRVVGSSWKSVRQSA
ncbi:hypothetical protein Tco_0575957 [Tanacetum coccineum]